MCGGSCLLSNPMGFLSLSKASSHYLHTFDAISGGVAYVPHSHPSYWQLNMALSFIFIRVMLKLIPSKMSCINHNNKQDTDIIFNFGQNL